MSDDRPTGLPGSAPQGSLLGAIRVLRERWWLIALATLAGALAMLALAVTADKQYEASSSIVLEASKLTGLVNGTANDFDPEREQATALLLVKSSTVTERVSRRLGPAVSVDVDAVDAVSEPDADLITITVTDTSPRAAAVVANAYAEEFVAYRREGDRREVTQGADLLRKRIAALPVSARAERQSIGDALRSVLQLEAVTTGNASVVDRAEAPVSAASPNPRRDVVLGAILGLAIGLGLSFLVDLLDRRIKSVEDFEHLYGIKAFTSIPERARDAATSRDRQAALEPFRILRNAVALLSDREVRVGMVTSAVPGEGKSTVAAGLSRAFALSGQNVVLVEADLRRPTFHQQFDLGEDKRGLTTALVGGAPASELLRPVLPGLKSLTVLPCGPIPPNAAELLRSPEFGKIVEELLDDHDVIVLDAPPLLPVADSQVLLDSPFVDAALVVSRAYLTKRDEVRRTRGVLEQHRQRNLGLVVNGLRELDSGYDYYGTTEDGPKRLTV